MQISSNSSSTGNKYTRHLEEKKASLIWIIDLIGPAEMKNARACVTAGPRSCCTSERSFVITNMRTRPGNVEHHGDNRTKVLKIESNQNRLGTMFYATTHKQIYVGRALTHREHSLRAYSRLLASWTCFTLQFSDACSKHACQRGSFVPPEPCPHKYGTSWSGF